MRGSGIGFVFGVIPGVSHIVSTFVSYAVEKQISKHPEEFGKGAVAGLAGPETANNATTGSAMIPLLILSIPAIPSTAILLSALQNHGVQPGPLLLTQNPEVFWGLIASMYIGNIILVALNLPLVGIFVRLLQTPMYYLTPIVLFICFVGVYSGQRLRIRPRRANGCRCCRIPAAQVRVRCCARLALRSCSAIAWKPDSGVRLPFPKATTPSSGTAPSQDLLAAAADPQSSPGSWQSVKAR